MVFPTGSVTAVMLLLASKERVVVRSVDGPPVASGNSTSAAVTWSRKLLYPYFFTCPSGSVTADVLVGPDGIARGIRFEGED